jgi:NADP-dependent 3-hydroxy acid dehydrogenase YdfG
MKQLYFSTKVLIPYFVAQGGGAFVNIASVSASRPRAGLVWYGASKAGVCNVYLLQVLSTRSNANLSHRQHELSPKNGQIERYDLMLFALLQAIQACK